jgi:hypothetical protein
MASAYAREASADSKRAIARKASDGGSSLALLAMTIDFDGHDTTSLTGFDASSSIEL